MALASPAERLEPILCRSLSRSGVEPPTGRIHPRGGRGTTDGKRINGKIHFGETFPDLKLRGDI